MPEESVTEEMVEVVSNHPMATIFRSPALWAAVKATETVVPEEEAGAV